jgi:hypothetical protein
MGNFIEWFVATVTAVLIATIPVLVGLWIFNRWFGGGRNSAGY